jgi:MFS family permease
MSALFGGVGAVNTGMAGASAAATLIASHSGDAWSGVPGAASVAGAAVGTVSAGVLVSRRGSRPALAVLYVLGLAGALVAFYAASASALVVLVAGMVLMGVGNGAAQMSRYVAAELYPLRRRGFALAVIVWAGTVGAVAGPGLMAPGAEVATWLGLPELAGPVLVCVVMFGLALLATAVLPRVPVPEPRPPMSAAAIVAALRRPVVLTPLTAMVGAQLSMVAVMTMTPLQLAHHGHGLDAVGWVLSAHMIGMFALAPLSGRIADRWGGRATIYLGIGTLALAAATVLAAPTAHTTGLPLGLFLLGYGWNLVFVGGSSMLSRDLPDEERTRLQGSVDAVVWASSAAASLLAGGLFGVGGYALVAVAGGILAMAPLAVVTRQPVEEPVT